MRLHGVASSTTKDLHGDTMLPSAIDDMEKAANNNLTIFLNHSYNVPEDVGGSVTKAAQRIRDVDQDGNPNVDLDFDILINDENPRAVETFKAIEKGTKLGLSIGAMIPEGGAKRNKDGTYLIEHVDLLETSIVGIPANPRSWVENAVKALKSGSKPKSTTVPVGSPTITLDGNNYSISGTLESTDFVWNGFSTTTSSASSASGNIVWDFDIQDAGTCPTCGKPKGASGCSDPYHKDVEPDLADAQVTIIQIDTSDGDSSDAGSDAPSPSQEAPSSAPETEEGLLDETADGDDAALGDTTTRSIDPIALISQQAEIAREIIKAKEAERAAVEARVIAETQRDAAVAERNLVLARTKQLLDRLADAPLMRKAVVLDAQREFHARFSGIYSEDFLKMLERNTDG